MTALLLSACLAAVSQAPAAELPPPIPQPVVPSRPPTFDEFAKSFKPQAGVFDITIIHPVTCKPVDLVFKLPEGCPRVRCGRRTIEFDYGRCNVEIVFRIGGRVGVEYRN